MVSILPVHSRTSSLCGHIHNVSKITLAGIIDTDTMTMDVDGEEKDLSKLLREYNGAIIELNVKTKDEQDLDEPDSSDEE